MSRESREVMWRLVPLNDGTSSSFALGWDRELRGNYTSVGGVGGTRSAFSLYPQFNVGVVILTNLLGTNPEELLDEVAASFVSGIRLSGVTELRAQIEEAGYDNLNALLAASEAKGSRSGIDEAELEDWIRRLLYSKRFARAVEVAKFDSKLFPGGEKTLELLAQAYGANRQLEDQMRVFREIQSRYPTNKSALDLFKNR